MITFGSESAQTLGVFLDRLAEMQVLDRVVEAIRGGHSRALVIRGEAGVGKTALVDLLARRASGCRVVRAAGMQAECELAFAGLHQLCAPLLEGLTTLPGPQQQALGTAFGLAEGPVPDRFLVGLAALGLLADAAHRRPLVCLVDDAHWLDDASAQALGFVGRRLRVESVALVFAVREEHDLPALSGLEQLRLHGLPEDQARSLINIVTRGPRDEAVVERLLAEARGNPLALQELPRGFPPAELAGGFVPTSGSLPMRIEASFLKQIADLPDDTRRLLLVAAAEPMGYPVLLWRAAALLGISVQAAEPAARAGLVDFADRVRFRHPLLRSAVYRAAGAVDRQAAHRRLAEAIDAEIDPDRRAWHRALAADAADEEVATDLERSAGRAQARGGLAATAAFLQRASELTPDLARRGSRALAAAVAAHQAGAPDAALQLLTLAEAHPLDELDSARAELLRAEIAFILHRSGRAGTQYGAAPTLLLRAARRLESLDVRLARDTYLEALRAGWFAGLLLSEGWAGEATAAARAAPHPLAPPTPADLLLDGLAVRYGDGFASATPMLKQALAAFQGPQLTAEEGRRWLWFAAATSLDLFDDMALHRLSHRLVRLCRDAGALAELPSALTLSIVEGVFAGEPQDVAVLVEELQSVIEATGRDVIRYGLILSLVSQGREAEADQLIGASLDQALRRGEGAAQTFFGWMRALLYNGVGRHEQALDAAAQATASPREMGMPTWAALVELITAASRLGRADLAATAMQRLGEMTGASGTDWSLGLEARCQALLADGADAETAYREAIDRLTRTRVKAELARAHLYYGEWLSRQARRGDARDQLRTAHEMFASFGMRAFAVRAAAELHANGEAIPKLGVEISSELTAQEAQIVRLVRDGLTNPEIAARLFLSPRTIEWHLGKVFAKLGIASRRQLRSPGWDIRESTISPDLG